ncbi:MAG: hypothetical protein RR956_04225 [Christensenella sp.]
MKKKEEAKKKPNEYIKATVTDGQSVQRHLKKKAKKPNEYIKATATYIISC